jgi:hypothetical protein
MAGRFGLAMRLVISLVKYNGSSHHASLSDGQPVFLVGK